MLFCRLRINRLWELKRDPHFEAVAIFEEQITLAPDRTHPCPSIYGHNQGNVLTRRNPVSVVCRYRVFLRERNAVDKSSALTINRFPCGSVPEIIVEGKTGFLVEDIDRAVEAVHLAQLLVPAIGASIEVMGVFRSWQPYTEEYKLVWNAIVGMHTFQQLADATKARVHEHYHTIVGLNHLDPMFDIAAGPRHDPFWLAFTMADLGIFPLLGPKPAKWFSLSNPRRARANLSEQKRMDDMGDKVLSDIKKKHNVWLDLDSLTPD